MIGERASVVLIDDDEHILTIFGQILSFSGFDIQTFRSPHDALTHIKQYSPRVVISDVRMDAMDGFELVVHLNELDPPPRVILLTGYYQREFEEKAKANGVAMLLEKPVRGQDLAQAVREILSETP